MDSEKPNFRSPGVFLFLCVSLWQAACLHRKKSSTPCAREALIAIKCRRAVFSVGSRAKFLLRAHQLSSTTTTSAIYPSSRCITKVGVLNVTNAVRVLFLVIGDRPQKYNRDLSSYTLFLFSFVLPRSPYPSPPSVRSCAPSSARFVYCIWRNARFLTSTGS